MQTRINIAVLRGLFVRRVDNFFLGLAHFIPAVRRRNRLATFARNSSCKLLSVISLLLSNTKDIAGLPRENDVFG